MPSKADRLPTQEITQKIKDCCGILSGMEFIMILCVVGVVTEHSHCQTIVAIVELTTTWAILATDAYRLGFPSGFSAAMEGLAILGLMVYLHELQKLSYVPYPRRGMLVLKQCK